MEKVILSRKMLYDLVWSVPLLTLSKKYAISDVGLRKICLRMNIPLPQAGHWQKLQFGKKTKKINLDAKYQGEQEIRLELRTDETKASSYKPSVEKELQLRIEEELKSLLLVPEKLTNPHSLIVAARESLNKRDRWEHNGLVNPERGILDIKVASANIVRSLRFMDTLIKALRGRGHSIEIWNDKTKVLIDGQKIEIQLREKLRKEIEKGRYYDSTIYVPKGLLSFQINSYPNKEWIDGNVPIEKLLSKILARLETIAQEYKVRELESKRRQEIRDAEEKIRKDYEQRKAQDLKDFKETLLKASRWHKATNLRNYIDAVEAKVIADNGLNDETQKWLTRARQKADWYDPFIEVQDELLAEIDRETLEPIKINYSFKWQP